MDASAFLNGLGAVFQIVGVVATGVGLRRTWREFGPEDEGWWDPIVLRARSGWRQAATFFRGVFRPSRSVDLQVDDLAQGHEATSLKERQRFRVLPENVDVRAALSELDERTRRVMEKTNDLQDRVDDESDRLDGELQAVKERLNTAVAQMEEQDRRIAAGGARVEGLGLFLIALGLLFQWTATLL